MAGKFGKFDAKLGIKFGESSHPQTKIYIQQNFSIIFECNRLLLRATKCSYY